MAEVYIVGQICSAENFREPNLFLRWNFQAGLCWKKVKIAARKIYFTSVGSLWKFIEGQSEGQTATDSNRLDNKSIFAHPVDLHLATRGIQSWPKLSKLMKIVWISRYFIVNCCSRWSFLRQRFEAILSSWCWLFLRSNQAGISQTWDRNVANFAIELFRLDQGEILHRRLHHREERLDSFGHWTVQNLNDFIGNCHCRAEFGLQTFPEIQHSLRLDNMRLDLLVVVLMIPLVYCDENSTSTSAPTSSSIASSSSTIQVSTTTQTPSTSIAPNITKPAKLPSNRTEHLNTTSYACSCDLTVKKCSLLIERAMKRKINWRDFFWAFKVWKFRISRWKFHWRFFDGNVKTFV